MLALAVARSLRLARQRDGNRPARCDARPGLVPEAGALTAPPKRPAAVAGGEDGAVISPQLIIAAALQAHVHKLAELILRPAPSIQFFIISSGEIIAMLAGHPIIPSPDD